MNKTIVSTSSKATITRVAQEMPQINLNAAGIDIGSREHAVAVPLGRDTQFVRIFSSFTDGFHEILAWLKKCHIETVAIESTGVYWIPIYVG